MVQAVSLPKFRQSLHARPVAAASNGDARKTRFLFFALCWYLLSQAYMIPIWAVGQWPIWPRLADVGVVLFAIGLIADTSRRIPRAEAQSLRHLLLMMVLGCSASYLLVTILFAQYGLRVSPNDRGQLFGGFFLFRMVQFAVVFWGTTRIEFTPQRLRLLRRLVTLVLVAACVPVILTYFSIVSCSAFVAHLPSSFNEAGPWAFYWTTTKCGWGTIGYNHAYTAVQILMLVALRMHLAPRSSAMTNAVLLLLALTAVFMSASRAGLAAMAMFSLVVASKKPQLAFITLSIVLCGLFTAASILPASISDRISQTFERQSTILEANKADNLSGRDQIWQTYGEFLKRNPVCIFIGRGFGSSFEISGGTHMLYLAIIVETGLIGLLVFSAFFYRVLSALRRYEVGTQPIFWATICLLVSSLTQETFYPVPALGHFLGLYLCGVAMVLCNRPNASLPRCKPLLSPLLART